MIEFLFGLWWLPLSIAIIIVIRGWWLTSRISRYISSIEWIMLEIRIPKDDLKSIKSMEQVFTSLHGSYSHGIRRYDRYFKGKVEDWLSLEMAGFAHGIHFYIRTPVDYRKLVETAFFSHYPDAEIEVVNDYSQLLPNNLPNEDFDIFGTDFILGKESAYPIRTYPSFENPIEQERSIDPLATITEVMSNLQNNESIWLQILIRPTGSEWTAAAQAIVNQLSGKGGGGKKGFGDSLIEFAGNLARAPIMHPEWSTGDGAPATQPRLTPGKQDVVKAVENKMGKLAFETIFRFIYIDKKDSFTGENVSAIMGAIRQFAEMNMNFFRPNTKTLTTPTAVGRFDRQRRLLRRKKILYQHFLYRDLPQLPLRLGLKLKTSILSTEELATIYHPPLVTVAAAKLRVLESRKGEPPINLPVVGE